MSPTSYQPRSQTALRLEPKAWRGGLERIFSKRLNTRRWTKRFHPRIEKFSEGPHATPRLRQSPNAYAILQRTNRVEPPTAVPYARFMNTYSEHDTKTLVHPMPFDRTEAEFDPPLNPSAGRFQQAAADYQRIEQAIRFLEANAAQRPSLADAADHVGLSPHHFQRLFTRWAGVSPARFVRHLALERARPLLQEGLDVLDTALEAGLSGPSRLHDLTVTFEALTPGEIRRGGRGVSMSWGVHDTPFGPCLLATTDRGICAMHFLDVGDEAEVAGDIDGSVETDRSRAALELLRGRWPNAQIEHRPDFTAPLVARAFSPPPAESDRPFHLHLQGTNFQIQVWQALLRIPPGATARYADVAEWVGRDKAVRAVAGAIGRNPVAWLIPCHRVIASSGAISGYRWGTARKRALLAWEATRG